MLRHKIAHKTGHKHMIARKTRRKRMMHNVLFQKPKHRQTRRMRKMVCHPNTINTVKNSCYTPTILEKIRVAFNEKHKDDPIPSSDPTELWKQLNARIVHCPTEDCWLNQLTDAKLRKQIDRYIFAPDKPYEWKKNPNEWLSNFDIMNVLEQYEETYREFEFIGPTPIDFDTRTGSGMHRKCVWNDLCQFSLKHLVKKEGKKKIGIIFNTDPHTSSGSHWISMFVDVPNEVIYFFDSAGSKPPAEVDVLAHRIMEQGKEIKLNMEYIYNSPHAHQRGNTECGMYSLYFIITMLTEKIKEKPVSLKQRLRLFSKGHISDKQMEKYRDIYFNEGPKEYNSGGIV
jgi:hypothetical protein